jgi:predicted membrane-bound spermidine synthase
MPNRNVQLLFALFALSGFTGLIYESIWSHYLKLFLGAAAFAQSFVLAAFMGGMALGAWIASRASKRIVNLLALYGWIEAGIGLAALVFHEAFVWLTEASLDHVIPALGSPLTVEIYKYTLCGVLIVPQTVLLGMTFPLMSGAVIRRSPEASGHHLAMLYFTNSIGAAAGALAAAFLLLGWIGMPGTMRAAGVLNLVLAAAVLALARAGEPRPPAAVPAAGAVLASTYLVRLFLAAAFVTGLASFVYEIAWIRMLSLVLGSSFQAFELMLHHRARARRMVDPPPHRRYRRPGALRGHGAARHGAGGARHHLRLPPDLRLDGVGAARAPAQRGGLSAVQSLQPRHRVCRHAAGDLPRRHDAAAVHARSAARRARRTRDRPDLLRQHARCDRGRAGGRAPAGA